MAQPADPRRDTTPRPSISPLSVRASPVAVRDVHPVGAQGGGHVGANNIHNEIADAGDDRDDRSSSLSEPEDMDDEDVLPVPVALMSGAAEELNVQQSMEVDSEAETERLEQTPNKARKHTENLGKTPSKLSHAATADDDLSEPPSPIVPTGLGAASSTSTIETAGKKRKRSDTAVSSLTSADSDLGESPRKRSHSIAADEDNVEEQNEIDETTQDAPQSGEASIPAEDAEAEAQDSVVMQQAKGGRGRKGGRPKGKFKKGVVQEGEIENPEPPVQQTEEQSEEAAAKSAEELQHKQAASVAFDDLAKYFNTFREKVYNEKLAAVDAELELLNQPDCKHPEYLKQVACVDARRQKQIKEIQAFYKYKNESLRRTTLGERSQLHSQYFQQARELREDVMYQLGEDWYNIQKERRQSHQEQDDAYIYKFPTKRSDQIKQQAKYNQEVSVLSGVAKYVGFPAAPDINGIEGESLEDDLKAMKISRRQHQPTTHSNTLPLQSRAGLMEGPKEKLAHDQFLEVTPWARVPQAPIPNHGTPNLTHTPDWAAEPGHSAKLLSRNLSGGIARTGSPYMTPMAHRRAPMESSSGTVPANSDPIEPPSSVMAAPPTSDRLHRVQAGRDQQPSPLAVNKHRQNGAELTGFRNISNVSGASTIEAPLDSAEKAREALSGFAKEVTAPHQVFETSHLARNGVDLNRQPEYANESFRPRNGTFGTPTPIK